MSHAAMVRGIEIYKGKPIFYNLGSLLMEFEAGEQLMTPEMYDGFGLPQLAGPLPSHLHMLRVEDAGGKKIGFYADPKFSRGYMAVCDIDESGIQFKLVPLDLDMNSARPADRGLPALASPEVGRVIAAELTRLSEFYNTRLCYNEAGNTIWSCPRITGHVLYAS